MLAKGRPDAAYAIAMGLCEHLPLLIMRDDIKGYLKEYKLRIGKLNRRNVDRDCHTIWQLMLDENKKIEKQIAAGEY